jgi:hypothetical protein
MKRAVLEFVPAVLALAFLCSASPGQTTAPAGEFSMRTFFSVRSAQPDDTIPDALREQFEKDDGSPLRSVPIDLDGDGTPEKLVLCGVPSASGGYQWLVYDVKNGTGRGLIVGALIFVGRETSRTGPAGASSSGP